MPGTVPNTDRERLGEMFALGESVAALSVEFGITERTVYRWLKDPQVSAIIREIRSVVMSAVSGKLQGRLRSVIDRLDELTRAEDERVALGACRTSAEIALKLRALEEFDERLKAIEARIGQGQVGRETLHA